MTDQTYYLFIDGQSTGPFTAGDVRPQRLAATTLVLPTGSTDWVPLGTVPDLQPDSGLPIARPTRQPTASMPTFLFGSLAKDLTVAALGGMGSSAVSFLGHLFSVGSIGVLLFVAGQIAFYWGLLQLGRHYQLRWVRTGAWLLLVSCLSDLIAFYTTGTVASVTNWLMTVLTAVGSVLAFVDLWALRAELDRRLVTAVVLANLIEVFVFGWQLGSQESFQLLEAVNIGLVAWLFYDVAALHQPQPAPSALVS